MRFNLPQQKDKAVEFIQGNEQKLICTVKKPNKNRSVVQNAYYWFMLTILENETGMDKYDFHVYFRAKYLYCEKDIRGEIVEYTKSTTELTTIEAEDYYSKIRQFASVELGCYLPLPNETDHNYLKL